MQVNLKLLSNRAVADQRKNSVVICATGASLTQKDCAIAQEKTVVWCIKEAYRLCPDASLIYGCDIDFWRDEPDVFSHHAEKWTQSLEASNAYGINYIHCWQNTQKAERESIIAPPPLDKNLISFNPAYICGGYNSGFQAINLAILHGFSVIYLLGFDMGLTDTEKTHFFGKRPAKQHVNSPYHLFAKTLDDNAEHLRKNGIKVVNCSRVSALQNYERLPIDAI